MTPAPTNPIQLVKAIGLVLLSALLVTACRREAESARSKTAGSAIRPFSYSYSDIIEFLSRHGIKASYPITVRRNPSGTALFVVIPSAGATGFSGLTVSVGKIDIWKAPAPNCFTTAEGVVVAWLVVSENEKRLEFYGGQHIVLPKHASVDVDPEGRYYIVTLGSLETWIGRVKSPTDRQLIDATFRGERVFAATNRVYVCGFVAPAATQGVSSKTLERCCVLQDAGNRFKLIGQQDLPWIVVDMDVSEERLLLYQTIDPPWGPSRLWIYDMKTGEKMRDGADEGYCAFFLTEDLLRLRRKSIVFGPVEYQDSAANESQLIRSETN